VGKAKRKAAVCLIYAVSFNSLYFIVFGFSRLFYQNVLLFFVSFLL